MSSHRVQDAPDLLAACLSEAEAGSVDHDQCPAQRAPDEAAWRDLVSLALELRRTPAPPPSASFRSAGYRNLMLEIGRERRRQPGRILRSPLTLFTAGRLRTASAWVGVLVALILCLSIGGGAVLAAEGALPGDALYEFKTVVEDVRLAVTPAAGDVRLHVHFAGRRLDEIEALLAAGRLTDVPRAAAEYESHMGHALQMLVAVGDEDTGAQGRLAAELDQMLSKQVSTLDTLAGHAPAQMAPVIQQVQSASADAWSVIKQLRTDPGRGEATELPGPAPTEPLSAGTQPPPASTPVPPAETPPGSTPPAPPPASPPPGGTPAPPPASSTPPAPPGTPPAPPPASSTPPAPPPAASSTPPASGTPAEPPPPGTPPVPPPPPAGTPPAPPPASSTPPASGTPAEPPPPGTPPVPLPPPAGTPPAPPPTDASLGTLPASPPTSHSDIRENTDTVSWKLMGG